MNKTGKPVFLQRKQTVQYPAENRGIQKIPENNHSTG